MRRHDDDGSIPLVLTVVILVGGIVAALVVTVIGTQRTVTFDRNYSEAITAADAGLQQALTFLGQQDEALDIGKTFTSSDVPAAGGNTIGSASFEWTATKDGLLRWEVRASGTAGEGSAHEVTRVLESTISADSEFFLAAFSDLGITFRGGNEADSYDDTGTGTGKGAIGSNNLITMNGNSLADFIFLYGTTAGCDGNGCNSGTIDGSDEQLNMDEIRATVRKQHADNEKHCETDFEAWTASEEADGGDVLVLEPGTVICATDVDFDMDVRINYPNPPDIDNPVKFLVTGDVKSSNGVEVNCPDCNSNSRPFSGGLQIYSKGSNFRLGNNNFFAAATLAPDASCGGGGNGNGQSGSNAQTDYFGSIVCEDLGNQGGWKFHFDENLLTLGGAKLDIASYREESTATSSFDWVNLAG